MDQTTLTGASRKYAQSMLYSFWNNLIILFIFLPALNLSIHAQTVVNLSAQLFSPHQVLALADLEGWLFKPGHNPQWADPLLDDRDWKIFKPTALTPDLADEQGRIEGCFRLWIHLDSTLSETPLGINRQLWAATEVYLDGELVQSFGHTGRPYEAYNPVLQLVEPVVIAPGRHLMAVHFVDYESFITPRELRLNAHNLQHLINLAGPAYNHMIKNKTKQVYLLGSLTVSVSGVLLILFLLLLFLIPSEKIFRLAAVLTGAVVAGALGTYYGLISELSYGAEKVLFLLTNGFFLPVMHAMTLLITEWVLKRRMSWVSMFILINTPWTSALGHIWNISWPFGVLELLLLGYFFYLVFTSRSTIRKNEWTVVMAMMVLTLGSLAWVFLHKYYPDRFYNFEYIIKTLVILSAPLLLLLYVALNYRQIIRDKEEESLKVIRVSEEKKALLAHQNELLEHQVAERTNALQSALDNLKATQAQLIQSEKMASLGELTAGIAHEIQNPLNFVNNFSEVNNEMLHEATEEIMRGNYAEVKNILVEIKGNSEKINHHGKRADAIVKGMLQHSRSSSGQKEPTDINALCEEYLRLAYHGLKAKEKSFDARFETHFDDSIPEINVVPQEMGRVILNLINNAFYVVNEKAKQGLVDYEPKVIVSTQRIADRQLLITVEDNGHGIPDAIKEKIFQPFFTTKPTGQGTGLGLSLSYDIVKAHGGEIKVETKEGEGTIFNIQIPMV